jgi:cellulose biosynthesis protein BcsQ
MDCPPIMNTCCVNALAASDYVFVPVTPSQKAAERVPVLLTRLRKFKDVVHPQLELMGLLLNRCSKRTGPTDWEKDARNDLQAKSQDKWGLPVRVFETAIPRRDEQVRAREESFAPLAQQGELQVLFSLLATEVERSLPGDCRRSPEVAR